MTAKRGKPAAVTQMTQTFHWVLTSETSLYNPLVKHAGLACTFTEGYWKPGDCVKVTMVKVEK